MNKHVYRVAGLLAGVAVMISVAGCTKATPGALQTESKTVELGGAKSAKVDINMNAGQLTLNGGANDLMKAGFTYNVARWKPEVSNSLNDGQASVQVKQSNSDDSYSLSDNGVRNEWAISLNNDLPIDLTTNVGAGTGSLDLRDVSLHSLQVHTGAGESTINLAGNYKHDFTANIEIGVGKTTVQLPRKVGARVDVSTGLGEVEANGLRVNGDSYENDTYGKSDTNILVKIEKGVGEVVLSVSDETSQ